MPITNGYDSQEVMDALFGRIKWRSLNPSGAQPANAKYEVARSNTNLIVGQTSGLSVGGTTYTDSSLTGWTYQVLTTAGVVVAVTFNSNGFTLAAGTFVAGTEYILSFIPQLRISKAGASGRYFEQFHPMATIANLTPVIDQSLSAGAALTTFLSDLEQGVVMTLLNGVFNEPQLIEDTLIYDRRLRQDNAWTNNGKFCGYRIYLPPGEFAARIAKASFIFNGVATFNLYLYQDMEKTPLYTQQVTTVAGQEVLVDLSGWILHYNQQSYSQGGVFYIGYYQNDLGSVQALDQFVSQWNKTYGFGYTAFEATQLPAQNDFNRIAVPYTFVTYGMNLSVETYRDFTYRIVKNASKFDEAIGLAMAVIVLGYQALNTRTNQVQRQVQDMATSLYNEINNSGVATDGNPYVAGLKMQLRRELKKINDNFFKAPGVITNRPAIWNDSSNLQGVFS